MVAEMQDSLSVAASAIDQLARDRRLIVAVDGIDGAGKTTFADALAERTNRHTLRASVDDFHNPRAVRYREGRDSPKGFYLDSFNLTALTKLLLAPFAAGDPFYRRAFDFRLDRSVPLIEENAPADAVLIVDGLFLHHTRLRRWWDFSILLDVPAATAAQRLLERDGAPPADRYVRGQALYFADSEPQVHASLVLPW
jgi:uridine kinase